MTWITMYTYLIIITLIILTFANEVYWEIRDLEHIEWQLPVKDLLVPQSFFVKLGGVYEQ